MSTPEHKEALRHLHAIAAEYGITHPELHEWCVRNYPGVKSLTDLDAGKLRGLAFKLDDKDVAATFRWKYRVAPPQNEPMFTPEAWAGLQSDCDAVAERFRR
jgi:hypothetical protein